MPGFRPRSLAERAARGRRVSARILALLFALLSSTTVFAQSGRELLRSEFWADVEPVPGTGDEWPVSAASARTRILDEAAWIYGGMVWGFDFSYTPYDKTRAVPERFDIKPIESLVPGSLSIAAGSFASDGSASWGQPGGAFRAFVEYRPEAALVSLMETYSGDPWKGAQGTGRADMNRGIKGRRAACIEGLRTAVRSLLQGLEPNKPRLVRGRVVFDRPPSLSIQGGYYTAGVRARAMVVEVLPYSVY